MVTECTKCRKVIQHTSRSMTLRCGESIHLKCFKKIVQRRYHQVCRRHRMRMRVRGRIGIPAYWLLPRCPGCRQFLNFQDLEMLEERLQDGGTQEENRTLSSIEEFAEYLRNIFTSDSSEEE